MKLLFLLLLLGIASVFSVDSVFAEELIPLDVEVNKQNFQFGDVVFLKITPEKIIPNTPFTMHLIDKHGNIQYHENLVLKENSKEFVYTLPNGYLSTVNTDEEYELHIYYGSKNNHVGYEIENISINSEPNKISKFIIENYFPDKFDIGTEIQIRDIRSYTFSDDLICDSIPCHEITLSRVYSESYVNFGSPSSNTNLIFYHFKNIENLTKYFNDFPEDFESYEMNGFTCHSIKAEPWEIKCHNEEILFHII